MKRSKFGVLVQAVLGACAILVASTAVLAAAKPAAERRPTPVVPSMNMLQASSMPTEATAVKDLQAFLDRKMAAWQVRKVENLGSEMTVMKGARIFVMDAMLEVKLSAAVAPKESEVMSEPWIARLAGKRGENRVVRMRMTWIKKENGWKLRSFE